MTKAKPGDRWRAKVGWWIVIDTAPELLDRYGAALDVLADSLWPHANDLRVSTKWEDRERRTMSLWLTSEQAIAACEKARAWIGKEDREPNAITRASALRPDDINPLIRASKVLAQSLKKHPSQLAWAVVPAAIRLGLKGKGSDIALALAAGFDALATALEAGGYVGRGRGPWLYRIRHFNLVMEDRYAFDLHGGTAPDLATCLGWELVLRFRLGTGAEWPWQTGASMPKGGKPLYGVAAAFVEAVFGDSEPAADPFKLKKRIEALIKATNPGYIDWPEPPA